MTKSFIALAAGGIIAAVSGTAALAQYDSLQPVRTNGTSTSVKNVDEPGRNPYQETVLFNENSTNCPNSFYCVVTFSPVPAGKRLVVTYASTFYDVASAGWSEAWVGKGQSLTALMLDLPVRTADNVHYVGAGPLTAYYDAGETPSIFIEANSIQSGHTGHAGVSGYFVKIN